ncbi:hypothetical protein D2N39_12565 [Gemmobacter lutimaris]|uniref:Uncharacterized protein n=1 Tax=Gemmobacter lutimaris TaxID=2306023 RepID=A0A398BUI4_9RHOB|nr:hypothetical protein [Gemmobacter lutimaris]RID91530.1 hypothetical protein D2N39_12565 [Gemmobacter lutimaris]
MRRQIDAWTDDQQLDALDRIERQGQSATEVGAAYGRSRSSVLGMVKRVRDDLAASEVADFAPGTGPAVKPANQDGALGPLWWRRSTSHLRRR